MAKSKFHVFLSHNSKSKPTVAKLKALLDAQGIKCWFDAEELRPGELWQPNIEDALAACDTTTVLIGEEGFGPWHLEELNAALQRAAQSGHRVIGVLLPGAPPDAGTRLPLFLRNRTYVDMREGLEGPGFAKLIHGITGKKPKPTNSGRPLDPDGALPALVGTRKEYLDERLYELYRNAGADVLEKYFSLLTYFMPNPKWADLKEFVSFLLTLSQGKASVASINGYPGTGKSCLLNCIYLQQQENYLAKRSTFFPVLVNLRHFLDEHENETKDADQSALALVTDSKALCKPAANADLMLIVDGCEDYYHHPWQSKIAAAFRDFMEGLSGHTRVLKIIGYGQVDPTYPKDKDFDDYKWAEREDVVQFQRVLSDDKSLPELLSHYARLNAVDKIEVNAVVMASLIRDHKIPEVDLFILSLIEKAVRKKWHSEGSGLSFLYANYCRDQIRGSGRAQSGLKQEGKAVKKLARDVFNFYVRRPYPKNENETVVTSKEPEDDGFFLLGVPHLHASVKEYLIAEHIVDLICYEPADEAHRERYIFPYGINRFVRSIINQSEESQKQVLGAIKAHYPDSIIRDRIHLAYLLGRFDDENYRRQAKRLVVDYLNQHRKENNPEDNRDDQDVASRQRLLLERTLSISAIYLEDDQAAREYLEALLSDPLSDNLNRGFHLEYYEDAPRLPDPEVMVARDNEKYRPRKTFEVLHRKLRSDLESKKCRAMTAIELHTLCSLCISRHIKGRLAQSKRDRLAQLLADFMASDTLGLPSEMAAYLEMAGHLIRQERTSVGSVFSELHGVKDQERAGWNTDHPVGDVTYKRFCLNPESVSDHIFGCVLLAEALLPETANYTGYSKAEIIRMLTIHDLMEAFTKDKPFFLKNKEDDLKENRYMRRTIALATVPGFEGIAGWKPIWETWIANQTDNAKIAHDIDKIENYVQLMRYYRQNEPKCTIEDAHIWASGIAGRLDSNLGKLMFASLRHENAELLDWFHSDPIS